MKAAIALLEENHVTVKRISEQCQRCAIFDKQLLWYGGINFLSYGRDSYGAMRLVSTELAKELLDMFGGV